MKRLLLLALITVSVAGSAFGQAGYIGLFSDAGFTDCSMVDVPGVQTIYAVHKAASGVTASQFMVEVDAGMACTSLGTINYFPTTIGTPENGISIAYGSCLVSDIVLFEWAWSCAGTSLPCSRLEVMPDWGSITGTIEVVDCYSQKLIGNGSIMYVNPNFSCDCGIVVPAEHTSWGQIKAMYQ
jgi:hypothetical protein